MYVPEDWHHAVINVGETLGIGAQLWLSGETAKVCSLVLRLPHVCGTFTNESMLQFRVRTIKRRSCGVLFKLQPPQVHSCRRCSIIRLPPYTTHNCSFCLEITRSAICVLCIQLSEACGISVEKVLHFDYILCSLYFLSQLAFNGMVLNMATLF